MVGRENDLEQMNRQALRIARKVADKHGKLMAGNICNTACFDPEDPSTWDEARAILREHVKFAVEEGADLLVAETYLCPQEAMVALEVMKESGNGLPMIVSIEPGNKLDKETMQRTAMECRKLEQAGATVVGINCGCGPLTIIEPMRIIREVCKGPLCCLPVPYRTTKEQVLMFQLLLDGERAFFDNLDAFASPQRDIETFGTAMKEIGVQYLGICCGNTSRYFRALAMAVGKSPPSMKYKSDMSRHYIFGDKKGGLEMHDYNTKDIKSRLAPDSA